MYAVASLSSRSQTGDGTGGVDGTRLTRTGKGACGFGFTPPESDQRGMNPSRETGGTR